MPTQQPMESLRLGGELKPTPLPHLSDLVYKVCFISKGHLVLVYALRPSPRLVITDTLRVSVRRV